MNEAGSTGVLQQLRLVQATRHADAWWLRLSPLGREVMKVGKSPSVLFSEFDLVASGAGINNYKAQAYKPESARKVLGNLLIYLTVE